MSMDDRLVAALAADLDGAFERLVLTHQDRVFAAAMSLCRCRADAEEVAQDAFVRAHRALGSYGAPRIRELRLRPWLLAITVNCARNRRRRRRPATVHLDAAGPLVETRPGPEPTALGRDGFARIAALMETLPTAHREAIVLRHVVGMGVEEAARALGRPAGSVKSDAHRGLRRLRAALAAQTEDR